MVVCCLAAVAMTSCAVSKETVNYKEVKNYFYRNDAPKGEQLLKLTTQVEFDRYFGAAAFMGKNGQPTQIDFKKDFVIARYFLKPIVPLKSRTSNWLKVLMGI